MLVYKGPSLLTGDPVVVLATGLDSPSANRKTGPMVQTWIIRSDLGPRDAIDASRDDAVCGDCPARRTWCYAAIGHSGAALSGIYRAYKAGSYPDLALDRFVHRLVRFGAYGDPAAVPTSVWADIANVAAGFTGYTHQWRTCDPELKRYCMASVDSAEEYYLAKSKGWRCYRVVTDLAEATRNEVTCPNTTTGITCAECRACNGTSKGFKGDIVIEAHGTSAKKFATAAQATVAA